MAAQRPQLSAVPIGDSDLFIANKFMPSMDAHGTMQTSFSQKLTGELTHVFAKSLIDERQHEEFIMRCTSMPSWHYAHKDALFPLRKQVTSASARCMATAPNTRWTASSTSSPETGATS